MSDKTAIQWTDRTFNPWWGCSRVSPACRFCYADRDARRYGFDIWRRKGPRRMLSDGNWQRPVKWDREAREAGVPAKVFCASMADVFEDHPQVADARKRLWDLIDETPWLIWQLLTKRIENVAKMAPWGDSWPANVWLGTSVESQRFADERIPELLAVPAAVRFLSCEPLLGPVDIGMPEDHSGHARDWAGDRWEYECLDCSDAAEGTSVRWTTPSGPCVNWLICGGESGPKARPSDPAWFRSLRDQCQRSAIPFFMKQLGEWRPLRNGEYPPPGRTRTIGRPGGIPGPILVRHGGHNGDPATWPADLRVREFPPQPVPASAA
jgi:protein gp37